MIREHLADQTSLREPSPVLTGTVVRLESLAPTHLTALTEVGLDPELWQWTAARVHSAADMVAYVEDALRERSLGRALPFAVVDLRTDRVAGCTRFGAIDTRNRRVEIGWTWIARAWQRTAINTEAKYLMLRYAFEEMRCIRVELKTDVLNERSRNAIRRLGAVEEGVLRSHVITDGGRVRDTVYYSILAGEWPAVRERLEERLKR